MMAFYFKKQEEMKALAESSEDEYVSAFFLFIHIFVVLHRMHDTGLTSPTTLFHLSLSILGI